MRLPLRTPHAAAGVLLAAGSAQGADLVTFLRMVRDHGLAAEANPIVVFLASSGHPALLLAGKVAVVGLVVASVALGVRRYPLAGALVATVAVAAGLLGAFSNVLVLLAPYAPGA